jgi:hypothetical protein
MKQRYKLTGFARLVIFLIIFLPIAYFGTKIYQGDMTFGDIQNYVEEKLDSKSSAENKAQTYTPPSNTSDCETMLKARDREIQLLKRRIATLEK